MSERRLTCADCGREFPFSAEEQRVFREKGCEPPKRCKECRQAKNEQRGGAMTAVRAAGEARREEAT